MIPSVPVNVAYVVWLLLEEPDDQRPTIVHIVTAHMKSECKVEVYTYLGILVPYLVAWTGSDCSTFGC